MEIHSVDTAFLETSSGKYVSVQGVIPKCSHQLVAQNEQLNNPGNSSKVKVYNIKYKDNECMAFGFELENKSVVFPFISHREEVNVKVLSKDEPITGKTFDKKFLFQWGEKRIFGEWGSLQSVAKPEKYLCVKNLGEVSITEQNIPDFRIQKSNDGKGEVSQNRCASVKIQDYEIDPRRKIWQRRILKRGPSCCEGSMAPNKQLRYNIRKTRRMKRSVKS